MDVGPISWWLTLSLLLLLLLALQVKHYVDYTANERYGLAVRFIGCLLATETEVLIQVGINKLQQPAVKISV
jgi:hypothetical protein